MTLTSRAARRGLALFATAAAAVAVTSAVMAAPGVAATPVAFSAHAASVAPPRCPASALRIWLGVPGDGYAGGVSYQLELSNVSGRACTLYGYPGVSALGPGGHQLGSAASRDATHPSRLITLGRGATAHVGLRIADVYNFSSSACHPAGAVALRVYPPNDYAAQQVPFTFTACRSAGPVYLFVSAAAAGTGIPGYSS
jgi:Domain of unknown function (DUF4232)